MLVVYGRLTFQPVCVVHGLNKLCVTPQRKPRTPNLGSLSGYDRVRQGARRLRLTFLLSPGVSRCRRCQRCRLSVEGVSRECRLTLVSRCRGCRGSVDGDLDIRDALMLSRCQRCQGGGWAHGQSKLIGVQSVPTAQGMSPYHNTSPQYTLEPQRRGLSTFPA